MIKTKRPQTLEIPRLAEVMPNLAALEQQRLELGRESASLLQEALEIADARRKDANAPAFPQTSDPEDRQHRLRRLMEGKPKPASGDSPPDRIAEINRRRAEIAALLEEIAVAIDEERRAGSRVVLQKIAALQRQRIRAVCDALRSAHEAHLQLHEFHDAIEADGVIGHELQYANPAFLGWPRDSQGPLGRYFHEMRRAGYLDEIEIPEDLR